MKKLFIILVVICVLVGIGFTIITKLNQDVEGILNEPIHKIELNQIVDGTYLGRYNEAVVVNATVEVTIIDHKIESIIIVEHQNGQGEPAEEILNDILKQQTILVDDITGATYSSRVIKLAIYNALKGGLE